LKIREIFSLKPDFGRIGTTIECLHESIPEPGAGVAALTRLIATVRDLPAGTDGAVLIDRIRALEELKSAAAATQARLTARFAATQRRAQLDVLAAPPRHPPRQRRSRRHGLQTPVLHQRPAALHRLT
jgi:hypothetical protein